jgi:uncharacterized tellurite resistance protein B-like protein
MTELLLIVSVLALLAVAVALLKSLKTTNSTVTSGQEQSNNNPKNTCSTTEGGIDCCVQLNNKGQNDRTHSVFSVKIQGTISLPDNEQSLKARIQITDMAEGSCNEFVVCSRSFSAQGQKHQPYVYEAELGKTVNQTIVLSDWFTIGEIKIEDLLFPLQGRRNLRFDVSIFSQHSQNDFSHTCYLLEYENNEPGYVDLHENCDRANALAVSLAFVLSAIDKKLYKGEIELIKEWARKKFLPQNPPKKVLRKLEKELKKTITFFRAGHSIDVNKICSQIIELVPPSNRHEIFELCLNVAAAKKAVDESELGLIKQIAGYLKIDTDKFRCLIEKILPINMYKVKDAELILGVTSDMNNEETREALNREYQKWNSRVTNSNRQIQDQADCMLKYIAELRNQLV